MEELFTKTLNALLRAIVSAAEASDHEAAKAFAWAYAAISGRYET